MKLAMPLVLAAAAPLVAQDAEVRLTREVFPVDSITEHGDRSWQTYRAVDGLTGRPIPNPELLLVQEHATPMRGEFWFRHRAVGDEHGFVRIETSATEDWHWVVLRAPGHGPVMQMRALADVVVPLAPAQDVPVRVLDPLERPVARVLVGYCGGCGHTPDLAHTVSDEQGMAVLRGLDVFGGFGDLYAEHEALGLGYASFRWFPGDPPVRFRPGRGFPQYGTVVDADGRPLEGAAVGIPEVHRGPWTRTAADGSFRLFGPEADGDLEVVVPGRRILFARPPERPLRLRVPPPNGEPTQIVEVAAPAPAPRPESSTEKVVVRLIFESERPAERVHVDISGLRPDADHHAGPLWSLRTVELAPGRYEFRVTADDHRPLVEQIEIETGEPRTIRLRPEPLPTALVEVAGLPAHDPMRVTLVTGDEERDVTDAVSAGSRIGMDPDAATTFVLSRGALRKRIPARIAADDPDARITLAWYAPTIVRGRLVDTAGGPVSARAAWVAASSPVAGFDPRDLPGPTAVDGDLALEMHGVGLTFLAMIPDDPGLAPRMLALSLPEPGDEARIVDLDVIRFSREPRLRATGAERARFLRAGWSNLREDGPFFPFDDRGRWLGPDPEAGDAVRIPPPAGAPDAPGDLAIVDLPCRTALDGTGPWQVQRSSGEVLVDVRAADGDAIAARVVFDDHAVEVDGKTVLRGVAPGSRQVWISAPGHRTAITTLTVPDRGRSVLAVELPRR